MRATFIARRLVRPTPIARYASPAESQRAAQLASGAQGKPTADDAPSAQRQRRRSDRPRGDGHGGVVSASEVGLAVASLLPPLPLYRRLLRAHRVLPIEMKSLGDQYVKDEFRRHRAIDNPLQIVGFLTQWKVYLDGLESSAQGDQFRGKKLDMQQFEKLSEEQMYQLHELLTATRELFDPERAQAQPPGGQKAVSEAVNEALERARQATEEEEKKKGN